MNKSSSLTPIRREGVVQVVSFSELLAGGVGRRTNTFVSGTLTTAPEALVINNAARHVSGWLPCRL